MVATAGTGAVILLNPNMASASISTDGWYDLKIEKEARERYARASSWLTTPE